MLARFVYHHNL